MENRTYSAMARVEEDAVEDSSLPDFPAMAFPPVLRQQAFGISDVLGVPLGMTAPMVLAVASASLGKGLQVRSLRGNVTPGNLYILTCKGSGTGGSCAYRHATAPLAGMQAALRREFENEKKPGLDAEKTWVTVQIEAVRRKLRDQKGESRELVQELADANRELADLERGLAEPLLMASDATSEGMANLLSTYGGETMAHFDSDAADAIGSILGRYGDRKHCSDSLWLKAFSLEPITIVRKHSGTIQLERPCLAVLFVSTPDIVHKLFRHERLLEGGLLPRFLVGDPKATPVPIDPTRAGEFRPLDSEVSQPYEAAVFACLNTFRFKANDNPHVVAMQPEALEVFAHDWNRICDQENGEETLGPFQARHTEQAIRIGVVLHAYENISIEQRSPGTYGVEAVRGHLERVSVDTARKALEIRDWFVAHQNQFLEQRRVETEDAKWEKTKLMLADRDKFPKGVTLRDLYTGRRVAANKAEAERLTRDWIREGRIKPVKRKPDGAGRPTVAYVLAGKA